MKMNSEKKSNKKWDKIVSTEKLVNEHLERAVEDLETSKSLFSKENYDWSFSIAYNSILQSARALMYFNKLRPKGFSYHISIITFLRENYKNKFGEDLLFMIDKFRKKRHLAVYGIGDIISEKECENCIQICEDFIEIIKQIIKNEKN